MEEWQISKSLDEANKRRNAGEKKKKKKQRRWKVD